MTKNQETIKVKFPKWFMGVAIAALVWNLLGVAAFIMDMMITEDMLAALPELKKAFYLSVPLWSKAAYGGAVLCGTLGCVGLIIKKSWARALLEISLICIFIQWLHTIVFSNSFEVFGPEAMIMPILVLVIAIWLVIHVKKSIKNGWVS